jgi:hypothetical protein
VSLSGSVVVTGITLGPQQMTSCFALRQGVLVGFWSRGVGDGRLEVAKSGDLRFGCSLQLFRWLALRTKGRSSV